LFNRLFACFMKYTIANTLMVMATFDMRRAVKVIANSYTFTENSFQTLAGNHTQDSYWVR